MKQMIFFFLKKSQATNYGSQKDDKAHLQVLTSLPPTFHPFPFLDKFCSVEIEDFGVFQFNKMKLSRGKACKVKGETKRRLIIHQDKLGSEYILLEFL